jgi:hypothetical protein
LIIAEDYTHVTPSEMKWSRDHVLTWGYRKDLMLTVDLDKLNVISSDSVIMKIDAKVCFPRPSVGHI